MKILYASHNPDFQGAVLSLYKLVSGLDRDMFTPYAVFSKDGAMVERLTSEGVDARVLRRRGFLNLGLIHEAYRLIKGEGIGLVHLNNAVPFCKCVAIAARLAGAKVVWHVREDPHGKRVRILKPWIKLLASRVIAVSTEIEDSFKETGKAVKIYNGVDTGEFRPENDGGLFRARYGIKPGAFVFGFVGTIEPRKGILDFLQAAVEILEVHPDTRFLVVGSGMPEYEAGVRRVLDKCLIVHEDGLTAGFGAEIAATIADEAFFDLDAPIRRLATLDVPIPYNSELMQAVTPTMEKIREAMEKLGRL